MIKYNENHVINVKKKLKKKKMNRLCLSMSASINYFDYTVKLV